MRESAIHWYRVSRLTDWLCNSLLCLSSAHLSPPFIGQGLNSGFRDAIGLSWRLSRVLKGQSSDKILQSYSLERRVHTQHLIDIATGHGDLICELEEKRAAEIVSRGEEMIRTTTGGDECGWLTGLHSSPLSTPR
jgi:hypothetical protein